MGLINFLQTPTLDQLSTHMGKLLTYSLATSTTRQYNSAFRKYTQFCQLHHLQTLLIHEYNLMLFATQLSTHSSYSSIKLHLSAIKHYDIAYGFHLQLPPLPRLYMLIRAIKRKSGQQYKKHKRRPITILSLQAIYYYLQQST